MPAYGEAAASLVEQINAAGIDATADARNLNLPGAWVTPAAFDHDYLAADAYTARMDVFLIVPDNGPIEALDELGRLAGLMFAALPYTEATPVPVALANHGSDPLPGLKITYEMKVS